MKNNGGETRHGTHRIAEHAVPRIGDTHHPAGTAPGMDADAQSYRRTVDGGNDVAGAVRHGQGERGHLFRVVWIVDGQSGRAHVRIPDGLDLIQLELVCQMIHDTIQSIQNANDF